jgi:hypothetical protein
VAHTYNSTTREAKAGVQGVQDQLGYIDPVLKKENKKDN